uniref:GAMMA-ctenitoxin-Pn1a n=2 Tax=Phoneutria TaxID=6917 RepID=TX35C_PHONI|nr:RecName: Full=GAMMA-ctenitoxin-Pn1a; Short=GAMMA-CNTX-Pn1a; AltName: Full=Insecticidal neurotoxin Tx4(5-5); Short=PnTx4(5-5); Short=PnTx4-5-5; AltName: Full=Toxin Pn4A; Flags: Precursor [Phoneutria nigriventer]
MKVAIVFLSLLVLAFASESIEENREEFPVEESARCADINGACKSDCDCCGDSVTCDCYWSDSCKCRESNFKIGMAIRKKFC